VTTTTTRGSFTGYPTTAACAVLPARVALPWCSQKEALRSCNGHPSRSLYPVRSLRQHRDGGRVLRLRLRLTQRGCVPRLYHAMCLFGPHPPACAGSAWGARRPARRRPPSPLPACAPEHLAEHLRVLVPHTDCLRRTCCQAGDQARSSDRQWHARHEQKGDCPRHLTAAELLSCCSSPCLYLALGGAGEPTGLPTTATTAPASPHPRGRPSRDPR
jgi:hypothetical protein